jgi:hypothetical protein
MESVSRLPKSLFAAAAILLLAAGIALIAALASPTRDDAKGIAEAREFMSQLPDSLAVDPGKVLHVREEQYERYGPKAKEIAAWTGIATEDRTFEYWIEITNSGGIARSYARTLDDTGKVVNITRIENGILREVDPTTGNVLRQEPPPPNTAPLHNDFVGLVNRGLAQGGVIAPPGEPQIQVSVLNQTDSQLTVAIRQDLPQRIRDYVPGPNALQVGYMYDLRPTAVIHRLTHRNDGALLAMEIFVESRSGQEVLISGRRVETLEVLDEMPTGLF